MSTVDHPSSKQKPEQPAIPSILPSASQNLARCAQLSPSPDSAPIIAKPRDVPLVSPTPSPYQHTSTTPTDASTRSPHRQASYKPAPLNNASTPPHTNPKNTSFSSSASVRLPTCTNLSCHPGLLESPPVCTPTPSTSPRPSAQHR